MFALAAGVGCGASTTDDASDPPGVVTDPNAMQPGFTNPNGTIGGAGMGSTMLPNPMTGSGGSGSTGTNTNNPNVITSIGSTKLPCNVSKAVTKSCGTCHGASPIGGAPMALVTYEDFQRDHVVKFYKPLIGQTKKVYDLAKIRINDMMSPMPPGGDIVPDDFTTIDAWLGAGAPAGTAADACAAGEDPVPVGAGEGDGTYGPLTPQPGETCYELKVHGSTDMVDDSKFSVAPGEEYVQFYYDVPWDTGAMGTRYGTVFDNEAILHHWLLFTTNSTNNDGAWEVAPLPTLIGDVATLLAGWAVGGTNLALPGDAGFELPDHGTKLNAQWHFYNSTSTDQEDHSAVQVCTVPAGMRAHAATITWVGTEDIGGNKWTGGAGMPPHQMSQFSGTCDPLREGMSPTEPIHILGFWPHMHQLGVNMEAIVNHQGGASETVFEKKFDFNHQIHYLQNYDLMPGDTLTARCTFNNTTDMGIPFGESSDT